MQNFTWQQQLRYYWDMDLDDCLIRHSDARVRYGYEYMGATRWVLLYVCVSVCVYAYLILFKDRWWSVSFTCVPYTFCFFVAILIIYRAVCTL